MALVRVRHASLYVTSKKFAEVNDHTVEYESGDELQIGDDGVFAVSDGAASVKLTATSVTPVSGATVSPETALQAKQNIDVQLGLLNGKIWQLTMRVQKAQYKSDAKAGTLVGEFVFISGEPTIN